MLHCNIPQAFPTYIMTLFVVIDGFPTYIMTLFCVIDGFPTYIMAFFVVIDGFATYVLTLFVVIDGFPTYVMTFVVIDGFRTTEEKNLFFLSIMIISSLFRRISKRLLSAKFIQCK